MLARFFKGRSRLDDPDPSVRLRAVEALTPAKAAAAQEALATLALEDADAAVRKASIGRLTSPDALAPLLDDRSCAEWAARRIGELIAPGSDHPLAQHPLVLKVQLLAMSPDDALPIIVAIHDVQVLADLTVRAGPELRSMLLDRINSTEALNALEHASRDHDKSLNRLARERLEQIRTARSQAAEARERALELADALERHQHLARGDMADHRRGVLLREFDEAAAMFEGLAETLAAAGEHMDDIALARARVSGIEQAAPAPPPSPMEPAAQSFAELVPRLVALRHAMERGDDFSRITSERQHITDAWLAAADHAQPDPDEHAVFEETSHAYRELADRFDRLAGYSWPGDGLDPLPDALPEEPDSARTFWKQVSERRKALRSGRRFLDDLDWPAWAEPGSAYADLQASMARLQRDVDRADQQEQALSSRLEQKLDQLTAEIDAGTVAPAWATLSDARALTRCLTARAADKPAKRLNHETARLAELRDWQTFATTPKREALCEEMHALAENPVEPADQAERIKHLRKQWNELGPVSSGADRNLANRFNGDAEEAFKPCRAYFAEQAELRERNLDERRKICDQLETYLENTDWAHTDMKAAERIMRTARSEWRQHHPVERNAGKKVEVRFEGLQGRLHERVKAEWDANLKRKQAIVDEARSLAESGLAIDEQVNAVKDLQRRWREVGITPRQPDQKLWRQFRGICDEIFAAREGAKQASETAMRDTVAAAEAIIDELEEALRASTPATAEERVLRQFQSRFADLPPLPERHYRALERRLDEAARHYRDLLRRQARDAERSRLAELRQWDADVTAQETARRESGQTAELTLPDPLFEPRLETLDNPVPEEALRELAIRAELLAGVESPAADAERRLRIQVDQLNAGMGRHATAPDPLDLAREWCAMGPKHASVHALHERLFNALARALED